MSPPETPAGAASGDERPDEDEARKRETDTALPPEHHEDADADRGPERPDAEPDEPQGGMHGGRLLPRTPRLDQVRAIVERHAKSYESRADAGPFGEVHTFHVQQEPDMEARFARIRDELRGLDPRLMALYRRERGEDVIRVSPRPRTAEERKGLAVTLFLLTIVTTVLSGAFAWVSYRGVTDLAALVTPEALVYGALSFALPLMAVLIVHEAAHHIVARVHHVHVSTPYFIPVPPIIFFPSMGTFGSVRSVWDPMPSRKALFDVGIAGPLAGFVAAIPVILVGLTLTTAGGVASPHDEALELWVEAPDGSLWGDGGRDHPAVLSARETEEGFVRQVSVNLTGRDRGPGPHVVHLAAPGATQPVAYGLTVDLEGVGEGRQTQTGNVSADAPLRLEIDAPPEAERLVVTAAWDRVESRTVSLGEPLAFMLLARASGTPGDLVIHPTALAGWVALVVTSISLLPAGQLDGGHVARALLGNQMRWASYIAIGGLMIASFAFVGWIYLVLLIVLFTGIHHPAPLDDHTPLDPRRRLLGLVALLVFALSFVPVPVSGL